MFVTQCNVLRVFPLGWLKKCPLPIMLDSERSRTWALYTQTIARMPPESFHGYCLLCWDDKNHWTQIESSFYFSSSFPFPPPPSTPSLPPSFSSSSPSFLPLPLPSYPLLLPFPLPFPQQQQLLLLLLPLPPPLLLLSNGNDKYLGKGFHSSSYRRRLDWKIIGVLISCKF